MPPPTKRPPSSFELMEPSGSTIVPDDDGPFEPPSPDRREAVVRGLPEGFAAPEPLPDYLRGVRQRSAPPRAETIGERPVPPPVRRRSRALPIAVGVILAAVIAPVGVAAVGAYQVSAADQRVDLAETVFAERMDEELRLRDELALLGIDRTPLDDAFTTWAHTAQDPDRADRALTFVDLVQLAVRTHVGLSDTSHEAIQVRARIARLASARTELLTAREASGAARASVPARLAATIGWAP